MFAGESKIQEKICLRKEAIMYAAIRKYSVKPGWMEEVMQRIQQDIVFLISQEPGFLNYYALRVGSNDMLTFSVFETQYEAEGSTSLGYKWVQENLVGYLQGNPEATVGRVFTSAWVPALP
jgi:quinol monooxygenase YgiN